MSWLSKMWTMRIFFRLTGELSNGNMHEFFIHSGGNCFKNGTRRPGGNIDGPSLKGIIIQCGQKKVSGSSIREDNGDAMPKTSPMCMAGEGRRNPPYSALAILRSYEHGWPDRWNKNADVGLLSMFPQASHSRVIAILRIFRRTSTQSL